MEIKNSNIFNNMKIKKYFQNQQPEINLTEQFIDPYFPPNTNSLLAKDKNGNFIGNSSKLDKINTSTVLWKTASDIFSDGDFELFSEKIECNDIKQGGLGDCYFLSALAALTEFPNQIYSLFRTKEKSPYGYYEIILYIEGEWQIVIIDDYLIVNSKNPKSFTFTKPNGRELWPLLLEKAWAKVNGGYRNIISGYPNEALNALSGFPSESYYFDNFQKNEIWELIHESDKLNNVMCASTKVNTEIDKFGLVASHAYSLIGTEIVTSSNNNKVKLIKLRNPWGYKEWNGDWSDQSHLWNEYNKNEAKYEKIVNDGIFFMSFDDFFTYYSSISICTFMPDCNLKSFKHIVNIKSNLL